MARDAMEGLIDVMIENGEPIPEGETPAILPRFNRLAHTLQEEGATEPIFEQLSAAVGETV